MYRPGNKNMEDKENRRYESMEDRDVMEDKENRRCESLEGRNLRTCIDLGIKIWRIKKTEDMTVWKIGN